MVQLEIYQRCHLRHIIKGTCYSQFGKMKALLAVAENITVLGPSG